MSIIKKHIMIAIAAVAMSLAARSEQFGLYNYINELCKTPDRKQEIDNITSDQWIEYFDQVAATNKILFLSDGKYRVLSGRHGMISKLVSVVKEKYGNYSALDEYDAKFVDSGLYMWCPDNKLLYVHFHRMHVKYAEEHADVYDKCHATCTVLDRIISDGVDKNGKFRNETGCEYANVLVERLGSGRINEDRISDEIKKACGMMVFPIRRKIREDGGTFVVGEDGVNPVQNAIDSLVSAFQSPNCSGVKELISHWCPDYEWVDVSDCFIPAESIAELKNKIFYGELELTDANAYKLRIGLGLDEYNRFIKEYNGDK